MPTGRFSGRNFEQTIIRDVADPVVAISTAFTRPADTAPYAASDVVSDSTSTPTLLTFPNAATIGGGSGMIVSARHLKTGTVTAGASFRLFLYRAGTVTPQADNGAFAMSWTTRLNQIGWIDFAHQAGGAGSDMTASLTTYVGLPYVCDISTTSLFGILTVTAAYTPTSAEQHAIELLVSQN